jgi:hypothetical protein
MGTFSYGDIITIELDFATVNARDLQLTPVIPTAGGIRQRKLAFVKFPAIYKAIARCGSFHSLLTFVQEFN